MVKKAKSRLLSVVVVDDELPIREELAFIDWTALGASLAAVCSNGAEALAACRRHRPDLLVSDIIMPVMSGLELLEKVRQDLPLTQVVMLTVSREFEYIRQAISLGALDYLEKVSFEPADLQRIMDKARARIDQLSAWTRDLQVDASRPLERIELRKAREIIRSDFAKALSLTTVAEQVGLNPSYLSHLFATELGEHFNDFLVRTRIEAAIHLIKTTNCKVYEIAEQVGIPNYRYFSEVFRQRTGLTPKDFRKGQVP